ncbi:MAG: FimV/HubP family polar landmark protein [Steroidobacteraceae bacterium]
MRLRLLSTAATLLAAPGFSLALGLGDIQLKSTLNAPLDAEIELIANSEELRSLQAQLATRESFSRYGLDYPSFLAGVQVRAVTLPDGRNVIRLSSSAAMTEPFATLLIEAVWARGRIQREYTLLFDPPAFAPAQSAPAPIAAPSAGTSPRSGAVTRPAAPPVPAAAASVPAPASSAGGEYQVRRGDSLSSIAQREYAAGDVDRGMIAIYRSNTDAFNGNINRLRAGAVLRLPDSSSLSTIDRGEAAAEVRRQAAAWSSAPATGGAETPADEARLRLVPPGGGAPAPGAGAGNSQTLRDRVSQLESELAESRRLLEVRNAELARLQGAAPPPTAPVPAAPPEQVPADQVAPGAPPPAAEPAAAVPPAATPAQPAPAAPAGPSLLDRLKAFWFVPAGLLVLLLGALGLRAARRRREDSESFAPFAVGAEPTFSSRDPSVDTLPLRKPGGDSRDPSIVVEETASNPAISTRKDLRPVVDLDEAHDNTSSMSVPTLDASGSFDQGDPLAEADFHMAYGLYDQAADLVKLAIDREPGRRDLKLKLLEVFFVWGNKDQFLQTARELAEKRDAAAPGEWEKVIIMGKQIAPEDALFSQSYSGGGAAMVDLNLEGGQNLVDFDLPGDSTNSLGAFGEATLSASAGDQYSGLDFLLDDPARGEELARTATTRQMAQPDLGDDLPTQRIDLEGPTVEQPTPEFGDGVAGKLDAHFAQYGSTDQTAELALDDLGLDLGKLEGTGSSLLDDSQLVRSLDEQGLDSVDPSYAPTLVAGFDEAARNLLEGANTNQPTELLPLADLMDFDSSSTARVQALDLDFEATSTGTHSSPDFGLDLDVGLPEQADTGYQATQRIDPNTLDASDATHRDLEPVTMSEVGTKLDLARAYMDMGDPDGARSILGEVLQEGSDTQRQEAQRLLDSIPG